MEEVPDCRLRGDLTNVRTGGGMPLPRNLKEGRVHKKGDAIVLTT